MNPCFTSRITAKVRIVELNSEAKLNYSTCLCCTTPELELEAQVNEQCTMSFSMNAIVCA